MSISLESFVPLSLVRFVFARAEKQRPLDLLPSPPLPHFESSPSAELLVCVGIMAGMANKTRKIAPFSINLNERLRDSPACGLHHCSLNEI